MIILTIDLGKFNSVCCFLAILCASLCSLWFVT